MSINKSTRKKLLLAGIITVLVVAFALGLWFFVQYQSNKKTVEVLPVTDPSVSTTYWGDTTYSSGMVTSESLQEIYQGIHALEEPYKEVFLLRLFGELSFAQIAALFHKTESWAR